MRTDVKIGLVLSLVVVVIAGVYFVGGDRDKPVSMDDESAKAMDDGGKGKTPDATASNPTPRGRSATRGPVTQRPEHDRDARPGAKPPIRTADRTKPRRPGSTGSSRRDAAAKPGTGPAKQTPPEGSRLLSDILPGGQDGARKSDDSAGAARTPPRRTVPATSALTTEPRKPGARATGRQPAAKSPDSGKRAGADGSVSKPDSGTTADQPGPAKSPTGADAKKPTREGRTREPVRLLGRAPRPQPTRLPPNARTHVISKGDTLAILAEIYYEDQSYADYLVQVNPGLNPKRLMVGTVILVPERPGDLNLINPIGAPAPRVSKPAAEEAAPPPRASGKTYTVKSGDSLWRIAKTQLGDQTKWRQIFDLNKDRLKSPDQLRVGQVLRLPED